MNNRVFFKNSNGLKDCTIAVSSTRNSQIDLDYKAGDFIYIGTRLPLNNLHFALKNYNTNELIATVEYYSHNGWQKCVETLDETKGFTKNGFIQLTPKKGVGWKMADTEDITELNSVEIYDRYWLRISFNGDFSTEEIPNLFWIGNQFSNDDDLRPLYPDLVSKKMYDAYSNTDSWLDQNIAAGEAIVSDLIRLSIIKDGAQILDWTELRIASIHKTAEIIYNFCGDDFIDQSKAALIAYNKEMDKPFFKVDTNNNAREEVDERSTTMNFFTR